MMDRRVRPPNLNLSALNLKAKGEMRQAKTLRSPRSKPDKKAKGECQWKDLKEWKTVSHSTTSLFQGKRLAPAEFEKIHEIVRGIARSEVGNIIYECYQESILKKGMIILREDIRERTGKALLSKLCDVWTRFYGTILPMLQALFYPITTHGLTVRQLSIVAFRDTVLLKTKIEDALNQDLHASPTIRQMLLVCLSIHDSVPPSENYMRLEVLVSKVVNPFLGAKGLYYRQPSLNDLDRTRHSLYSVQSSSSGNLSVESSSPPSLSKKLQRPVSMVQQAEPDPEFDDLIQHRRQKYRNSYGGQRLAMVKEGASVSSSLASLLAEGFDVGV